MMRAGARMETLVQHYGSSATTIIAAGSCASFGGCLNKAILSLLPDLALTGK
jgi:Ni,Fe-hydrogenase I small subunit